MDQILSVNPNVNVVWAHMGLTNVLRTLHPRIHTYIIEQLFERHENLYIDISSDILANTFFLNHDNKDTLDKLFEQHADMRYYLTSCVDCIEWDNSDNATKVKI